MKQKRWTIRLGWLVVGVAMLLSLTITMGQRFDGNERSKRRSDEQSLRHRFPVSPSPRFSASPSRRFSASPSRRSPSRQQSQNVKLVGWTGGFILDVFVQGRYAYCASGPGLIILDISNPFNPQKVGGVVLPVSANGVYVSGSYAYVANEEAGLRIIDISNPQNPREVGYYDTPGGARGVYVSGSYAYVADGQSGLRVIDISNPQNPREVGYYDTPGGALGVYVSGSYAYVANGEAGLFILRFTGAINHPPSIPTLISPADGATVSPTPTFKLKAQDPDGDQVKFEIQVTKGNEAKTFTTDFVASDSEVTFTVPSAQALSAGQWSWKAKAIDNKGAESGWSSEQNFTVQTGASDLVPKELQVAPIKMIAGGKVNVCFKVINQGQAKASAFKTRVRLSQSADAPSPSDPLLAEFDTSELNVTDSVTYDDEVTIPSDTQPGDYYVWVIVDVDSTAGQFDETNDRIKTKISVVSKLDANVFIVEKGKSVAEATIWVFNNNHEVIAKATTDRDGKSKYS